MRSSAGRYLLLGVTLSLFVVSLWQVGGAVYIHAKAELSQVLLKRAWARTLEYGEPSRPWPWADTWPVARLRVPRLGIDQVVLAGASGASLAFAPGHLSGTASPGETGSTVISGHRDTHFRFLRELKQGDRVLIETVHGYRQIYRIREMHVVHTDQAQIPMPTARPTVTLVTCYPFDAVQPGGPLRYVVTAVGRKSGRKSVI